MLYLLAEKGLAHQREGINPPAAKTKRQLRIVLCLRPSLASPPGGKAHTRISILLREKELAPIVVFYSAREGEKKGGKAADALSASWSVFCLLSRFFGIETKEETP